MKILQNYFIPAANPLNLWPQRGDSCLIEYIYTQLSYQPYPLCSFPILTETVLITKWSYSPPYDNKSPSNKIQLHMCLCKLWVCFSAKTLPPALPLMKGVPTPTLTPSTKPSNLTYPRLPRETLPRMPPSPSEPRLSKRPSQTNLPSCIRKKDSGDGKIAEICHWWLHHHGVVSGKVHRGKDKIFTGGDCDGGFEEALGWVEGAGYAIDIYVINGSWVARSIYSSLVIYVLFFSAS